MADWKKIIVSGSQAELAGVTGSFTGSFIGDGSSLSGISSFAVTNEADNRVITSTTAGNGNAEANLTFNGFGLGVTGTIIVNDLGGISGSNDTIHLGNYNSEDANSRINGFAGTHYILQSDGAIEINHPIINLSGIPTGTDNSVVVWTGTTLATDEIDSRVWGSTLVDAANGVNNRLATFSDSNSLNGEANLTFDGSTLTVNGGITATGLSAGTDNTVLVLNASNQIVTDEIDSRVWGSTLVDSVGLSANYITFANDSDTITGASDFTYNPDLKILSVTNATITGDLVVQGTTTELQVTNLSVEDQFILLGSGSAEGSDKGIIFDNIGGYGNGTGSAFFFDGGVSRLSYATSVAYNATSVTPAAYIPLVFDVTDAVHEPVDVVGNIKIEDGEAFIYA
jgi:hypothetical protein